MREHRFTEARGATEEQFAKFAGENMLRVLTQGSLVGDEMDIAGVLPIEEVREASVVEV